MRRTGRFAPSMLRLTPVALAALCATLLFAGTVQAAEINPALSGEFECSVATPCGADTTWVPRQLAVDEESGDIWVLDTEHAVVDRFSSSGAYLGQISGTDTTGGHAFAFAGDSDIAVDNSGGSGQGTVYLVTEGGECASTCGLYAFSKSGGFLWEKELSGDPCGVAVDPSGGLWTAEWTEGVQKRSGADGSPEGSAILAGTESCHLDFTAAGDILLNHWAAGVDRYDTAGDKLAEIDLGAKDVAADRNTATIFTVHGNGGEVSDESGALLGQFGIHDADRLSNSHGVAVDGGGGRLYVSDSEAGDTKVRIYAVPVDHTLTVTPEGTAAGTVGADSGAISACSTSGGTCTSAYEGGVTVTLDATPAQPHTAVVWSGCDTETATTCTVTMGFDREVTADFEPLPRRSLTVTDAGTGAGSVACDGGPCATSYYQGEAVTLAATPVAGSHFAGWSGGGCSGTAACVVTIAADTAVTAAFDLDTSGGGGSGGAGGGGGGSTGGGGNATTQPPNPTPLPTPAPRPLTCKKGFKKQKVHGKLACVKVHHKHKKHHR